MIKHQSLGNTWFSRSKQLLLRIRMGEIKLGGNRFLRIYGTLHCRSGIRMKLQNRVFFASEAEAWQAGFRPCGHCLPEAYKAWKNRNNQVEKLGTPL